jgi:hypothetical protein
MIYLYLFGTSLSKLDWLETLLPKILMIAVDVKSSICHELYNRITNSMDLEWNIKADAIAVSLLSKPNLNLC